MNEEPATNPNHNRDEFYNAIHATWQRAEKMQSLLRSTMQLVAMNTSNSPSSAGVITLVAEAEAEMRNLTAQLHGLFGFDKAIRDGDEFSWGFSSVWIEKKEEEQNND